jgi:hypothetical protein
MPFIPAAGPVDVPEEFKGAVLYVEAGKNMTVKNKGIPWKQELDEVKIADGTSYKVNCEGVWKDDTGTAWFGKQMNVEIKVPDGMLGTLYVHIHDWNNNGRTGLIEFEGRKVKLGKHTGKGKWVKFHVMREDSNDGKLILKTNAVTGPNLMITKLVLVKEE